MGLLQKVILGRWLTRWILRGGPWAIGAKLAAVALFGAWKWHREKQRSERAARSREIEASYEVLGDDRQVARLGPKPDDPDGGSPSAGGTPSPATG